MLEFYGYDKCDSCRKAKMWLDEYDVASPFIDITEKSPWETMLKALSSSPLVVPNQSRTAWTKPPSRSTISIARGVSGLSASDRSAAESAST